MSNKLFYREQAARQQADADAATLDNVRDRCQRAADAWTLLAERIERADSLRAARDAEDAPLAVANPQLIG
ncbi:MAG: hypothetical protein AVDCRST_MAG39-550 [uncultured Sphingomonadaceae bacterium]|uniref:Uncharacterized protein n=1 Tax=uncultured Sphingomonadaceae bacterium TaxID=169976 RepID=A0A6J4SBP5_9SPHN|nr:MAG: hypothetical protein AVDCRST_MAG39-550 [uncultured Sphingomonadaceae bacterium]